MDMDNFEASDAGSSQLSKRKPNAFRDDFSPGQTVYGVIPRTSNLRDRLKKKLKTEIAEHLVNHAIGTVEYERENPESTRHVCTKLLSDTAPSDEQDTSNRGY